MTNPDLNPILFLLKALDDNLNSLSKDIAYSEHVVGSLRRDWIALESKYRAFKEDLERITKA